MKRLKKKEKKNTRQIQATTAKAKGVIVKQDKTDDKEKNHK